MFAKTNFKTILLNKKMRGKKNNTLSQHDELKPNLKNPKQKQNMGVGSYCHVDSPTNLKKNPIP